MALAVHDLLSAPDLPLKIEAAKQALARETEAKERFRDDILPHEKGEFINGQKIMHSPARHAHNHVSSLFTRLLGTHVASGENGILVYEKALCGFSRNDYEPDIVWFSPEKSATITPDTLIYPIPDFIIEILSPSTATIDRGIKLTDYAAHGVREYWIVDPEQRSIEQYLLAEGADIYHLAEKLAHGDIKPISFPGLAIPLDALFEDAANLAFLRTLL